MPLQLRAITYIGGDFSYVGPTRDGIAISIATGLVLPQYLRPYLRIEAPILAVAPDGSGLVYGGEFTRVGRVERNGIAHIRSDFSLDTSGTQTPAVITMC